MKDLVNTIGDLRALSQFAELMVLFQRNFPRDFRKFAKNHKVILPPTFEQIVEGIDHFLIRLGSLFPVSECGDFMVEQMAEGGAPYLPVWPVPLMSEETGPEDLHLGYRVILAALTDPLEDRMVRTIAGQKIGHWIAKDSVRAACATKRRPLCFLADAYNYSTCDTGNVFLDFSDEEFSMSEPVDFTQEMIDFYAREWKEAKAILKRCNAFNDWIEVDMRRVRQVVNLLQEAAGTRKVRLRVENRGGSVAVMTPEFREYLEYRPMPLAHFLADLPVEEAFQL